MPRVKQKTGTRRSTVVARTRRKGQADRLRIFDRIFDRIFGGVFGGFRITPLFRRGAFFSVAALVLFWAWLWVSASGIVPRTLQRAEQGFYRVSAADGFAIRDVLVEGRKNADPDVLLGLLRAGRGEPIFAFDPGTAQAALEKDPWIESARVERRLPGVIFVTIRERVPVALWQNHKKLRLIDAGGHVITDAPKEMARFKTLPLVVGDGAAQEADALLGLLKAEPLILQRLYAAVHVGDRRWDLKLKNGTTIRLPELDTALALSRLAAAQERDALLDRPLDTIDLREKNRIIIRESADTAAQDYKDSARSDRAI